MLFVFSISSSFFAFFFHDAKAVTLQSISINRDILQNSIELVKDSKFLDKFNLRDSALKAHLRWVFEARCEAVMMFAKIGREKARRLDSRVIYTSQLLSLFQKDVPVGLKEIRTEQVRQVVSGRFSCHCTARKMSGFITWSVES